jgi:hypothetical protein
MVRDAILPSSFRTPEPRTPIPDPAFFSNTFQNFRLSSAAAVASVCPSGLRQECKTLLSWAGISTFLTSDGYDQIEMLLSGKPEVLAISL